MKRLITLLAVLVAFTIFTMSTYAKPPDPYAMPVEVVNEPAVNPIPVVVERQETRVRERLSALTCGPMCFTETYTVPAGFHFRLQYVSVGARDVNPNTDYRPIIILAIYEGGHLQDTIELGTAEYGSHEHTTPYERNIVFGKNVNLYAESGEEIGIVFYSHPNSIDVADFRTLISGILEPVVP